MAGEGTDTAAEHWGHFTDFPDKLLGASIVTPHAQATETTSVSGAGASLSIGARLGSARAVSRCWGKFRRMELGGTQEGEPDPLQGAAEDDRKEAHAHRQPNDPRAEAEADQADSRHRQQFVLRMDLAIARRPTHPEQFLAFGQLALHHGAE